MWAVDTRVRDKMTLVKQGGCLCGKVRYEVNLKGAEFGNCHCKDCQKNSGAPFISFAFVDWGYFRWINEPDGAYQSSPNAYRKFCTNCSSAICWESKDFPDGISINAGTLDDISENEIQFEIFTCSRWPGIAPINGARQYVAGPK
jgi:hypothetical protein